ncbi:LmeA family phospholipid-binding protein [Nocardia sp. NPDC056000]|uniref:LmeA family phospholipid-binding protein n=1 Tax=Nocardia sp. NPDC056000 TaxID=3345674 RepID=UPI0035E2DF12
MSSNPTSDDAKRPEPDTETSRANGTSPAHPGAANYEIPSGAADSGAPAARLDKPETAEPQTEILGGAPYPAGAGGTNDTTKVIGGNNAPQAPATPEGDAPTTAFSKQSGEAEPAAGATEWWHEGQATEPATEVIDQRTQVINGQGGDLASGAAQGGYPDAGRSGANPTEVLGTTGSHHTQVLDPGEAAAYAAGAATVGGTPPPPGTPPPTANNTGGEGGSPRKSRKKRTLLIVGLVAALIVVGGLAGGEAYARRTVENCISSQFEAQMGSKIDVSFGAKPMLLTMFDNKVGKVTVDSDDTKFGPAVGMVVHATFHDIEVQDQGRAGGTIGSSEAEVDWSNDGIVKTLGGLVSGATSDPSAGTLSFNVLGGLAQLQVKPKIVGDKVEVETMSASLLGFGLPTDLVSGIVELMTESLQTYPMGLQPTKVEVTSTGIHVSLKGGKTTLEATDSTGKTTNVTC